jgi:ankyrin repeat protein
MLKQAMSKLEDLNTGILKDFELDQSNLYAGYTVFEKFTEDLVPSMLRQATEFLLGEKQHGDHMILSPLFVRLFGDCIYKPLPKVGPRCMVCSSVPDHDETFRAMLERNGDLVNELHLRVFRLACHMSDKSFGPPENRHHGCDDSHHIQSELHAISVLSKQITARINNIFNDGTTGLDLPATLRESAIFIPDYGGCLDGLFIGQDYVDCLGRTSLHRLFDLPHHVGDWMEPILRESSNSLTYTDILGRSPLHIASWFRLPSIPVKDLLRTSNVNIRTVYGHTPLHYAVVSGKYTSIISKMFAGHEDLRLDPNLEDVKGRSAFSYLVKNGDLEETVSFLNTFNIDLNSRKSDGMPPLREVIQYGRTDLLGYLLGFHMISPTVEDDSGGTPIHWAIADKNFGSLDLLGKLTSLHWDQPDRSGCTPLHHAARITDDRFIKFILARLEATGVNHGDEYGFRPLHQAFIAEHYHRRQCANREWLDAPHVGHTRGFNAHREATTKRQTCQSRSQR